MSRLRHHRRRSARPAAPGRQRERGASLVLVAFALVPLLIISALVVDVGYAKQRRRLVQSTADAAALAAAQELDGRSDQVSRAVAAAKTWAAKNQSGLTAASWVGCSDPKALAYRPESGNTCISFDSSSAPTKVRVRVPVEVEPQFFGRVAGSSRIRVDAVATAGRAPGAAASTGDCGLCARDWIQWAGTQNIQVIGGGTVHTTTMTANWNTTSSTVAPCPVKAVASANNPPNARCPGTQALPITFVPQPPPDPFAGLPDPPTGIPPCQVSNQACNVNSGNAATLLKPGVVFTQGVDLSNVTINLAPGNYYFAGALRLQGNATLTGTGVTLFFVCANSNQASKPCSQGGGKGFIEAQNSGNKLDITAPTTGPYAGMAIYFDRNNSQGTAPKFSGNNSTYTIRGNIYAYGGKFTGDGNRLVEVYGQIYTQWWEDNGGGTTRIHYAGGSSSSSTSGGTISLEG